MLGLSLWEGRLPGQKTIENEDSGSHCSYGREKYRVSLPKSRRGVYRTYTVMYDGAFNFVHFAQKKSPMWRLTSYQATHDRTFRGDPLAHSIGMIVHRHALPGCA